MNQIMSQANANCHNYKRSTLALIEGRELCFRQPLQRPYARSNVAGMRDLNTGDAEVGPKRRRWGRRQGART